MKLSHTQIVVALAASTASALTCSVGVAQAYPPAGGISACNGDPVCEQIALEGQCNSVGGDCSSDELKRDTTSLECTSSETCYSYGGDLMCLNDATGDYHDNVGGTGNAISGVYTAADGNVITNTGTAPGTLPGSATNTVSGASTTRSQAQATTTSAAKSAATITTTSAAPSRTGSASSTSAAATATTSSAAAASQTNNAAGSGMGLHGVLAGIVPFVVAAL